MPFNLPNLTLPFCRPIIAFAIVLGITGGTQATASCGDYLHTKNSRPAAQESDDSAGSAQHSQTPCHGKDCQRQEDPAAPPVPAPTTPTQPAPEKAVPSERVAGRLAECVGRMVSECQETRRGFPAGIDRPPESTVVHAV